MRAFVALPVSPAVREAAARLQEELRKTGADVGWTRPDQMHLTVKFLGEIDPAQAAGLAERLKASLPRRPLDLEYAGLGRFPKVIWAGVKGEVAPLADVVEKAAEEIGVGACRAQRAPPFRSTKRSRAAWALSATSAGTPGFRVSIV